MADGHGGARPGAGRKANADKYAVPLQKANDHLAYAMPDLVKALLDLALGRTFETELVPAGSVFRKDVLRIEAQPGGFTDADGRDVDASGNPAPEVPPDGIWRDDKGKPVTIDVPVYPDLPPDQLVIARRKTHRPDIKALMYVWDRLEGRPNYVVPPEPHTLNIRKALKDALAAAGKRKARPPDSDEPPPQPATTAEVEGDDDDDD